MFIFLLYNLVLLIVSPVVLLGMAWRLIVGKETWRGLPERFGLVRPMGADGPVMWVHAVSVGETVAAQPVEDALATVFPGWGLVHSAITVAGHATAVKSVGERGRVIFFPLDLLPCVWLALTRIRPRVIVLLETELWPNYLAVARLLGCRVVLVNGIIAERSLRGARGVPWVYRWMAGHIDRFCMQSDEQAGRVIALGADPARVVVVGNTKFDQTLATVTLGEQVTLRKMLSLDRDEPVLLAGSTHPGEEEIVLRAFRQVRAAMPHARLVIAPRHLKRVPAVEELIASHGFIAARRTKVESTLPPPDAVIILDSIGELARAYALCEAAVVGGSLVPGIGGHNILEPLGLGKPAIFGPYTHKNRDIVAIAIDGGVGFEVADAEALAERWLEMLQQPHRTREIARKAEELLHHHRGASQRSAEVVYNLVSLTMRPDELDAGTMRSHDIRR